MARMCALVAGVLLSSVILPARPAAADTITITSGSAVVTGTGASMSTPIHLEGNRGFIVDSLGTGFPSELFCADQCVPGATVSLGAGWGGFDLNGLVTLDGVTYEIGPASAIADATIMFAASALLPPSSGDTATVTVPFQFTGRFSYPTSPGFLAAVDLVGAGTVTSTFLRVTGVGDFDRYIQQQSLYRFNSTSPVPEPATMLLVGTGMLWGLRTRMRRR